MTKCRRRQPRNEFRFAANALSCNVRISVPFGSAKRYGIGHMKLNLGCGFSKRDGFVNVDNSAHCAPDMIHDLETFPWPWADSSVDEILMRHVLEHLGATTDVYFAVLQEMYRVCRHDARITVVVPHPRHDDFLHDATHVRAVTLEGLSMFSRKNCEEWIAAGNANTPLAMIAGVDFDMVETEVTLEEPWRSKFDAGTVSRTDMILALRQYNNVAKELKAVLRVVKE